MSHSTLTTDLYQLTMLAGYLEQGMQETEAVFDLFFRHNPFHGGYAVFAGLEPALEYLENLRFRGDVTAPREGTVVFANEPLLTVEGPLAQAQLVETALLNIINFQTLVATRASGLVNAAAGGEMADLDCIGKEPAFAG